MSIHARQGTIKRRCGPRTKNGIRQSSGELRNRDVGQQTKMQDEMLRAVQDNENGSIPLQVQDGMSARQMSVRSSQVFSQVRIHVENDKHSANKAIEDAQHAGNGFTTTERPMSQTMAHDGAGAISSHRHAEATR